MTLYKDYIATELVLAIVEKEKKHVLFETKSNHKAIEEALKVDYKNILKVWNKNGEIIWSK